MACAYARTQETCESSVSNIRVNHYIEQRTLMPMTCLHCEEAWCMSVCPAGAITRNADTQAVVIDANRCAGCKMCMLACPFGNIHFDNERQVSHKCDLCDGDPKCVGHCIAGALKYQEMNDLAAAKRSKYDQMVIATAH
ncbi:4Fe-4S dicluster domain-containing protein [Endozoicomonas sp. SCSIO W0465]|nr:4Fe-4S dicluster domain-containing protein [Endozoicomonas sp. SCSIO W0465]